MAMPQSNRFEITGVSVPWNDNLTVGLRAGRPGSLSKEKRHGCLFVAEGAMRAAPTPA